MKKILLATVAIVPLLAAGMSSASAQEIKQQGKEGMSQSSPARAVGQESRSQAQGKEIQGKSDAADKVGQNSAPRVKTEGKAQAKSEPANGGAASSDRTARQDKSKDQAGSESSKQALGSKAKQGADESKDADRSSGTKAKQQSSARGQTTAAQAGDKRANQKETDQKQANQKEANQKQENQKQAEQKQANEPQKEPARTTGQATRPNQENAEQSKEPARQNGADENRGSEAGGRVTLTQDQRTKIQKTVLSGRDAPRVDRVDFDVNVGVVVPNRIRIAEVPATLVEINPQWRGDEYFVVRDEIVIIDHGRRIVATVPVGSSSASIETRSSTAGSGGYDIRRVQEVLIEKGFYHGRVDGTFGPETRQALIMFQRREGMEASGRIDERTYAALGVSGRTEGRAGQTEEKGSSDQKQGQAESKGQQKDLNNQPSTSGQAGSSSKSPADHSLNGQNDNAKSNEAGKDKSEQNDRPSTSGQAGRVPSTENKASGQPSGASMKPQNEPANPSNAGAGDNQRKRD